MKTAPLKRSSAIKRWVLMQSNETAISFRPMKPGEEASIVDLVLTIFSEFVAPQYSREGIAEFEKFVCPDVLADRLRTGNLILLAESGQRIVGVIEIRDNSHIALLFVEKSHQRKGIAKELIRRAIKIIMNRKPDIQRFTVNSSPNAFTAYRRIGFAGIEEEKLKNGIRFIPMELIIENNGGSQPVNSADPKGRPAE